MIGKSLQMWLLLFPSQQGSLAVTVGDQVLRSVFGGYISCRELALLDQHFFIELSANL